MSNDEKKSSDIEKLVCFFTPGEVLVCDECHQDYIFEDDSLQERPVCPKCAGNSDPSDRVRLEMMKSEIGFEEASHAARTWWRSMESQSQDLTPLINLADQLLQRQCTIEDLYQAFDELKTNPMDAVLLLMEYRSGRIANLTGVDFEVDHLPHMTIDIRHGISNTANWTDAELRAKLREVQSRLDFESTTGQIREWWVALVDVNETRLGAVLRLAEELAVREATIREFYVCCIRSRSFNFQANLLFMDYLRLQEEERKAFEDEQARKEQANSEEDESSTFVMCPNCKSLHPPHGRCRNCGHRFES